MDWTGDGVEQVTECYLGQQLHVHGDGGIEPRTTVPPMPQPSYFDCMHHLLPNILQQNCSEQEIKHRVLASTVL